MTIKKNAFGLLVSTLLFGPLTLGCQPEEEPVQEEQENKESPDYSKGKGDIIGEDDRRDEYSEDVSDKLREVARSTAVLIENQNLIDLGDGTTSVTAQTLRESYYMCSDENNVDQPTAGFCSAWLIAPDIMMTNGHCITSQSMCETSSFVFDFALTSEDASLDVIPTETVVSCERVLHWDNSSFCDTDFAVIKLSRPVTDREPVKVRHPEKDEFKKDNLAIIGHPFGLPRKYALNGQVVHEGSNAFLTSHDIIGGNSGSAIFDAETGEVQGLISCGGSNFDWYTIEEGWSLQTKTGKTCDQTCDDAGLYFDGMMEDFTCAENNNMRRRCVCDGNQLVWEARECTSFDDETNGACTRERRHDEQSCLDSPWLCSTPVAQNTSVFYRHVGQWSSVAATESLTLQPGETRKVEFTLDEQGVLSSASLLLDFSSEVGVFDADPTYIQDNVVVTLHAPDDSDFAPLPIISADDSSALTYSRVIMSANPHSSVEVLDLPIELIELTYLKASGTFVLEVTNNAFEPVTLYDWALNYRAASEDVVNDVAPFGPCFGDDCVDYNASWPEPVHESFDSDPMEYNQDNVKGTLGEGLSVEVFDEDGVDYEVFKTRSSQTMSLTRGEFAVVKTFDSSIGLRDITLDYRYDGEGWFQIWAGEQIIFSESSFSQQTITVSVPDHARSLKFVLGAVDDSRIHELTLFDLSVSAPAELPE